MDTAKTLGLTTLVDLLNRTDLGRSDLQGPGPFTFFAPTNEALASIDLESMSSVSLENLLKYHVVRAQIPLERFDRREFLSTEFDSHYLSIDYREPFEYYRLHSETGNAALVNRSDAEEIYGCGGQGCYVEATCSNGVIFVVDAVLIPQDGSPTMDIVETIEKAGLTSMVNCLEQANLTSLLQGPGPFTLFASTNRALRGELYHCQDIMLYNIVDRSLPTSELTDETVSTLSEHHPLRLHPLVDTDFPGNVAFGVLVSADGRADTSSRLVTPGIACTNGVVYIQEWVQVPAITWQIQTI